MEKRRKFNESIKAKLTLIVLCIMAVPLILSVIISYNSSHNEAVSNMNEMNAEQVELVEHDFRSVVDQNMQILQTVANSVSAREVIKGNADKDEVQEWLAKTDAAVGDDNVLVIVDANGMQIVKSEGECIDVSEREYFQKVKETCKFYVSDQNISKTTGARICTFIYPVLDKDGTFIGAVQRDYNLTVFTELVKNELTAEKQNIFIGDNNGDIIAHTSMDLEGGEPVNYAMQQWYTDSRSDEEASGSYDSNFDDGNWKISYRRDAVTGWTTVIATDVDEALSGAKKTLVLIVVTGVLMLVIAAIIVVGLANSFTKPILSVNDAIDALSNGEFTSINDPALVSRRDEYGDIVKNINELIAKLSYIVGNIKEASTTVTEHAKDLASTSGLLNSTAYDLSNSVQDIAGGATEQAGTVERATGQMNSLSDAIKTVATNAEVLANAASDMNEASKSSATALKQLSANMGTMGGSLEDISNAMRATNAAVQSVNKRVDGITSIASQTNLLALNASIEAASAGEAGRGFAVVAEEIGKLAAESATTAQEIRDEMSNLLKQAQESIEKTNEVSDIGNNVNEVLDNTVQKINMLIEDVDSTVSNVSTISGLAMECDASKNAILEAITNLAAISEESAATTEETSASMQELNATTDLLSDAAKSLDELATKLDEDLSFFKI